MKAILLMSIVFGSLVNVAVAEQMCVQIPRPEFSYAKMEAIPADQVRIVDPRYKFNGTTYRITTDSAEGLCKVYGKALVRIQTYRNFGKEYDTIARAVELDHNGVVIDSNYFGAPDVLSAVVCW